MKDLLPKDDLCSLIKNHLGVLFVTHPITPNEQRRSPFGTIYLIFAIYVETGEYTEHNTQLQMIGEDGLIT